MNTHAHIIAESLGEAWLQCLELIVAEGEWIADDGERLMEINSFFASIGAINAGDEILARFADQDRIALMRRKYSFCGVLSQYKISYGKLLYDFNGVNQIEWVIDRLRRKRESKSATIALHAPGDAILSCLSLLDFKIRNEELQVTAVYRSQNAFASQPGNLIAIREIQSDVADSLCCIPGSVDLLVASVHIYERDLATVKNVLSESQVWSRAYTTGCPI